MSERESQRRSTRSDDEVDEVEAAPASTAEERSTDLDDEVDAMLDEIDDVLETNAAEFVQGFVQKGGQ